MLLKCVVGSLKCKEVQLEWTFYWFVHFVYAKLYVLSRQNN